MKLNQLYQYIPYNVRVIEGNSEFALSGSLLDDWINYPMLHSYTVKLRNMYDIDKPITVDEETFVVFEFLTLRTREDIVAYPNNLNINWWAKKDIEFLLQYHFDIAGLIESGFAIDMSPPLLNK